MEDNSERINRLKRLLDEAAGIAADIDQEEDQHISGSEACEILAQLRISSSSRAAIPGWELFDASWLSFTMSHAIDRPLRDYIEHHLPGDESLDAEFANRIISDWVPQEVFGLMKPGEHAVPEGGFGAACWTIARWILETDADADEGRWPKEVAGAIAYALESVSGQFDVEPSFYSIMYIWQMRADGELED